MLLTAYHDSNGNLVGLAVSPADDSIPAEVISNTQPGVRMAAVDVPSGITFDFNDQAQINNSLNDVVEKYQIDKGVLKRNSSRGNHPKAMV